jgi:hypothetical protein
VTSLGREVSVRNLQVLISSIGRFVDGIFSGFPTMDGGSVVKHNFVGRKEDCLVPGDVRGFVDNVPKELIAADVGFVLAHV